MTQPSPRPDLPALEPQVEATRPYDEGEAFHAEFDRLQWAESEAETDYRSAGGRTVLASALVLLALAWTGYIAWSAGRTLGAEPLSSPLVAQWLSIGAAPLGLMGLAWLIFGRTRRREAERFTRSVITMRTEARALETVLGVLSQRIDDSQASLTDITRRLMSLGDEATGKLDGVSRGLDASSDRLLKHGEALDRAAESARNDIAVLLDDLPRAEATARAVSEQLRGASERTLQHAAEFERQVGTLGERTRQADEMVAEAAQRLLAHLTHIESAGAAAAAQVGDAETAVAGATDALLGRTVTALDEIRAGIDVQAATVTALVQQASAGFNRTGVEASEAIQSHVTSASGALDGLAAKVAEQERASQRMLADVERSLAGLHERFAEIASHGDDRATAIVGAVARARSELEALGADATANDSAVTALAERTTTLREEVAVLSHEVRERLMAGFTEAEIDAERLLNAARTARPEIEWMRDAAAEAAGRIAETGSGIAGQQDRLAGLLASLDEGVQGAEAKLASLSQAISTAQIEAANLTSETGPALVAAMVRVREAAAHAAERAREAMAAVIPESAANLSSATREALEQVIRDGIEERLREVEVVAGRAVETARAATDRLTQQMLNLGQSATALERHLEEKEVAIREKDSEAFARRVALLIDSMHSASIDVGKILSDEIDEKAWDNYLKGNRGIFTRRAVKLLDGSEAKAIRAYYEADGEFQQSVNRYVHDFEAMLRRVVAERDGGIMAVTLMSSDTGKLYAALAQAIERRR
jgi:predicted  nucleic acid-binding Zn-ribbon protein